MFRLATVAIRVAIYLTGAAQIAVCRREFSFLEILGRNCALLCEELGGAFPKIGQILSTRADLIPDHVRASLCELQDNVSPLSERTAFLVLERAGFVLKLGYVSAEPMASATVAQVHKARRIDDGREVALKLLRPEVRQKLEADCRLIQLFGRLIARLPKMSSIPVNEALAEVSSALICQTDFQHEAHNHLHLHRMFADSKEVIVPELHKDLCTDEVLVMDFIPGMKKLSDPTLLDITTKQALTIGIRALYKMIFMEGFLHCDMHPGNVLVDPDGRLVILDAGFMIELTDEIRWSFAEFFLAITFMDGNTAAKIVRETAIYLPRDLNIGAFDNDITDLIICVGDLKARDFQVAAFVSELFAIMRKHQIHGTSQFTLIILSLLVYEGVTKQCYPDLDFQQEALPFVMAALLERNLKPV